MKKLTFLIFTIVMVVLVGCESESTFAPNSQEELSHMPLSADQSAVTSHSNVYTFADMTQVGHSALTRNDGGVSFTVRTSGLEPNTANTLWIVVFNKPENCSGPCGEDDLFTPSVMTDVMYSAGRVVMHSGKANYAGTRRVGDNKGSIFPVFGVPSPGLMDARKAEIHLIVRTHGEIITGLINEMISTFAAGCAGFPPALGTPGPNTCEDIQFAVHK